MGKLKLNAIHIQEESNLAKDKQFGFYGEVLSPSLDPYLNLQIYEESEILPQAVEARVHGLCGFGHHFEPISKSDVDGDNNNEINDEKRRINNFIENCNMDQSFDMIISKIKKDCHIFGYGFLEIIRDIDGFIHKLYPAPAESMRLTRADKESTLYATAKHIDGQTYYQQSTKRFRRFIQIQAAERNIYFKEFGDPRNISKIDGRVYDILHPEDQATEILFFQVQPAKGNVYPKALWHGAKNSIAGAKLSQDYNNSYLSNGYLQSLALVLPPNTNIDEKNIRELETQFTRGVHSSGRILTIETVGSHPDVSERAHLEKLTDNLLKDGSFINYQRFNHNIVLSSLRVPPILVGLTSDYNKATSETAYRDFEEQVCAPERKELEWFLNNTLFRGLGIIHHKFRLNSPNLIDSSEFLNAMKSFESVLPPNELIYQYNNLLNRNLDDWDTTKHSWADKPVQKRDNEAITQDKLCEIIEEEVKKEVEKKLNANIVGYNNE